MSRVYDNWERLVEAVLKREQFKELAYCESFSSSSSADFSPPSSLSASFGDFFEEKGANPSSPKQPHAEKPKTATSDYALPQNSRIAPLKNHKPFRPLFKTLDISNSIVFFCSEEEQEANPSSPKQPQAEKFKTATSDSALPQNSRTAPLKNQKPSRPLLKTLDLSNSIVMARRKEGDSAPKYATLMGSSLSLQSAVKTIHQCLSRPSHVLIFDADRREINQYMEAVDRLHQTPNVKDLDELMSVALARLRGEFIAVLSRQAEYQARPNSTTEWSTAYAFRYGDYVISEPRSDYVITYLRDIAGRMDSCGKLGECIEVYKSLRKNFLQSQLKRLRFEELSIGYNARRYSRDELKVKMELWIQVSKICVEILFEREKQLCEKIFDNAAKDECFIGTVQDFAVGLFGFAEDMSLSNQSYDRMEAVLGLYNAFVWVLPYANALFDCELGKGIRNTCEQTLSRMENDVRKMLYDFENAVLNEVRDVYDDTGVIHQLTCYVMEQVEIIVRNKNLLTNLINSTPLLRFGDLNICLEALGDLDNHSFLELHLILILVALQRNLETKSRSYKNPPLEQLFMMNNICYMLQKIEGSNEFQEMIGDSYMRKLNENFKVAKDGYETSTCNKFLTCFQEEGLYITQCFTSQSSKTEVRKRIKNFNDAFEEIQLFHSIWKIPNPELKADVRASMSKKLVPAYKHFLEKFEDNPEIEKNVKYSVEDFEILVLEKLFADTEVVV